MQTIWQGFKEGTNFRLALYWILRLAAVIVALIGLFFWIGIWVELFRRLTIGVLIGGIIAQLLFIAALAAIVWTLWQRAAVVRDLPTDAFPVFDITAVITRLLGEVSAIALTFIGVAGWIIIWSTGRRAADIIPFLVRPFGPFALNAPPGVFFAGLSVLAINLVQAVLVLLTTYFIAEAILMLKGLFDNTRALREAKQPAEGEE